MIQWTQDLETGSALLDRQHRLLIDNINLLKDLVDAPNPARRNWDPAVNLVDYLEAYADQHFKDEEECMERFRCPVHALNPPGSGNLSIITNGCASSRVLKWSCSETCMRYCDPGSKSTS